MTSGVSMIEAKGRIFVAGNLSLDDIVTPQGTHGAALGGDALYSAIGARLWGAPVTIITVVGEDFPNAFLDHIRDIGIDGAVRRVAGPTVHYRVTYSESGDREFVDLTPRNRLAETSPDERDYERMHLAAWLHVAAMPIEAQATAIRLARARHVPASLDPHEEYVTGHESTLAQLISGTAFMPSELEASRLFPVLSRTSSGIAFGQAAATALDRFTPTWVAIKLGASGSVVRRLGRTDVIPSLGVKVVDPTGAGDAYCGGFIAGLLATGSHLAAGAAGAVAASQVIARVGALNDGMWPPRARLAEMAAEVLAPLGAVGRDAAKLLCGVGAAPIAR